MRLIMARAAASGRALYLDAAGTLVHTLGSRYAPSLNGGQGCLLRPALPVDEG
ncbi:hypothetical protein P7L75_24795 [Tistrella mobilis]|uniref:hypothetical protein n=1 Tax=Tistrella mobilis TaxID=171437 RepID=UPI00355832E9